MDRRRFLSQSALGAGALGASALGSGALAVGAPGLVSGCGAATPHPTLAAADAREIAARLRRGLGRVRDVPHGAMARAMPGHPQPELAERVMRLGLEAMVLLDVTRSVPEGAALPDALATQLAPELPILDRYAATYHAILAEMPRAARRSVDAKVRARPGATMEIAGWLDEHARDLGVASGSRLVLRAQAADVDVRMRRQSPTAVIDDCVAKMDRAAARSGTSIALARSSATNAMLAAIWQQVDGIPRGAAALGNPSTGPIAPAMAGPLPAAPNPLEEDRLWREITTPERQLWTARWARPGDSELQLGAILMPLGLVTCGVLLIVGLVAALVGVVENASWDGLPRVP